MTLRRSLFFSVNFFCVSFCIISLCAAPYAGAANLAVDNTRLEEPSVKSFSNALAHYIMGSLYDNQGDMEAAVQEYEKALEYGGDISEVYLKIGTSFMLHGRSDEAESMLTKSIEIDPENTKSYQLLALIYSAKGDLYKAQELSKEALKYDPDNIKVLTFLSELFLARGELDSAAEVYERILRIKGDDAFLYFNLGVIYSKRNLFSKAEETLEKAVGVDESNILAHMLLGYVYEIEGKFERAIEQYNNVILIEPLTNEAYARMGQLYYRLGKAEKAIEQNRILMKLDPASPGPYLTNYSVYVSEKDYEKAKEVLNEALDNGITDAAIHAGFGYMAGLEKDYKKSSGHYSLAVKKEPSNRMYRFYLAAAVDQSGRRGKAIKILEDLVKGDVGVPEAYNYLGYLYVEEGRDLDRAIILINKALSFSPENGAYLDSLGWAYFKKGMLDEAFEKISMAVEILPEDPIINEHMGDVYSDLGDSEKALIWWKKSLEFDPGNESLAKKIKKTKK